MTDLELLNDLGLSPMTPAEIAAFNAEQAAHKHKLGKLLTPIILSDASLPDAIGGLCGAYSQSVVDNVGAEIVRIVNECDDARPGFWDRDTDDILSDILIEQCGAENNQLIYDWNSRCYLMGTNNHDAYHDETGDLAPSVQAAATRALIADLQASHWYTDAEAILKAKRTA